MKSPSLKEIILGKPHFVPNNLNVWYVFGALLLAVLALQFISGLWLAMFYQPSADQAFNSIEYIMREVRYGWFIRYIHTTGASALFILLYLHMLRGLIYRSYHTPRQLVWFFGVVLFWLILAEAFLGYLLPWGQMSYWGATVVTNLFSALPHSDTIIALVRGDYQVSSVTLTRFYALHIIALPMLLVFVIQWHIRTLHAVGSGNPQNLPIHTLSKSGEVPKDCVSFSPIQASKDLVALALFAIVFFSVIFFLPHGFGLLIEPLNHLPANPLNTPQDIHPLWYMACYYAILRVIPNKLAGIILLLSSLWLWLVPLLFARISVRFKRAHQILLMLWLVSWLGLTYLGLQPSENITSSLLIIFTIGYFLFFLLALFI